MDAAAWDERYAGTDLVWSAGPNRFVAEQVTELAPGRALDLAGGEGRNAIWLAAKGWDVELVEFSRVALDKAARTAEHHGVELQLTHADLTAAPDLEPADLVLLAYLQLDRQASARVTRTASAAVRTGGTLLVIAHARRNLTDGVGGPSDPAVLRTVDEVVDDLAGTGLAVRVADEVMRTVDTPDGPRDAIDLLVRAERPGASDDPQ
jgi:SAM-dependent methyltransferase